jgi:hypothetical protein
MQVIMVLFPELIFLKANSSGNEPIFFLVSRKERDFPEPFYALIISP